MDWVLLARGMGVPATRVDSTAALREALGRSLAEPGPHLIDEMMVSLHGSRRAARGISCLDRFATKG